MSIAAIECHGISHSFPMGGERFYVLKDINLTIKKGEMVAIIGPSGSGKSTLMNLIGGLMTPESGQLSLLGTNTHGMNKDQLALVRRDHIGFVFQQFHLLARTSALENVMMPTMYQASQDNAKARAIACLELVGLGDKLDNSPNQLSGGQQQRVAIARALINQPDILLADEPTGALDTKTSEEIISLFRQLNQRGHTVVIITHEPEVAERADRIITVRDGHVIETEAA